MRISKTWLLNLPLSLLLLSSAGVCAQATKSDIFSSGQITWLGLDFTQAKFIGMAYQFKDAGEISNQEFRDKYAPSWNQLFITEMKKYDVAQAVNRMEVKYAIDVTDKANSGLKDPVFSDNPDDYSKLSEDKINQLIKRYDFKGNKGIGLLFFVDGLSKAKEEANVWVTFVNLDNNTVLLTKNVKGKAGGIGYRNYWAGAFNHIVKEIKSDFKKWQ